MGRTPHGSWLISGEAGSSPSEASMRLEWFSLPAPWLDTSYRLPPHAWAFPPGRSAKGWSHTVQQYRHPGRHRSTCQPRPLSTLVGPGHLKARFLILHPSLWQSPVAQLSIWTKN